jgi:glycosyltransferase involved in cell wall biosynthesis
MRLALVGPFPPYRGGIAQFTDMLSSSFERYGDTVERISYRRLYPSLIFPGRSQIDSKSPCPRESLPLIDSVNPGRWAQARKVIRSLEPDGILAAWWHPFFAPALLGSLPAELSTGIICHNVTPHESFPLSSFLTARLFRRMDLIAVHCMQDKNRALEIVMDNQILQLFHPLYDQYLDSTTTREESRELLGYSRQDRVVLFFGLIRPYKGLEDLVDAFRFMPDNVKLLIVGECYSDRRELYDRLDKLQPDDRFNWIEQFVPADQVSRYFLASDLVALPYRRATQSGVAQIALAFGKPLVLTDTGGLSEVVDEGSTGFLVPPEDPPALAEGILRGLELAREPGLDERIAAKAGEFSWDEYVRRIRKIWP